MWSSYCYGQNRTHASKASPDDTGGLQPVVMLAKSARVMLTSNLWINVGLVNGSMGTVEAICYLRGIPPCLSTAVLVHFDHYTGPTMYDGLVPMVVRVHAYNYIHTVPLKLAYAISIHKSQGCTPIKLSLILGREFSNLLLAQE